MCEICGEYFDDLDEKRSHLVSSHNKCLDCRVSYRNARVMKQHLMEIHECHFCPNMKFRTKQDKTEHNMKKHVACDECEKVFENDKEFEDHQAHVHTYEMCMSLRFKNLKQKNKHLERQHSKRKKERMNKT